MAPIALISAPPLFITREQHDVFQASTPASGDLLHEPVLHHLERSVNIRIEPSIQGFDSTSSRAGDIYVTEGALSFFDPSTSKGFSVPYPTISIHATSRPPVQQNSDAIPAETNGNVNGDDHNTGGEEQSCVYCQLDENECTDYDNLAEEDLLETRELYITPSDPSACEQTFHNLDDAPADFASPFRC